MTGELVVRPAAELVVQPDPWEAAVEAFLTSKRRATTRKAYRTDLRQWRAFCARRGVDPWRAHRVTVDTWAAELEDADLAPSSVGRKLSAVASLYKYLARLPESPALAALGWTWVNPALDIDRPSFGGEGKTMALTAEELDRVLKVARWPPPECPSRPRGASHGRREAVAVLLMGTLAIRARELLTARRSDYVLDHGRKVITVTRKGGKTKKLVLDPPVAARLDTYLAGTTGDFLIGTGATDADYQWLYRLCEHLGLDAGISTRREDGSIERHLTPHVFRATFATLYLDTKDANLAWLQDFMGHASPDTTRLYDRGANALRRLADVAHTVTAQLDLEGDD